jgi:hypothetical protein
VCIRVREVISFSYILYGMLFSLFFFVGERGSECISVMWYCVLLICVLYGGLKKVSSCVCSGRFSLDVSFNIRLLPYKEQTGTFICPLFSVVGLKTIFLCTSFILLVKAVWVKRCFVVYNQDIIHISCVIYYLFCF